MSSFYLLSYKSVPLGIYNKLHYLFDYILELVRFPDKTVDLSKIEINIFEVNIGYPSSSLRFRLDNRVYLEETNGKRVEMCSETFSRFKKIQKYYENTKTKKNVKVIAKKEEKPLKTEEIVEKIVKQLSPEEIKEIEEKQKKVNEEQKQTIYEMNRLKRHMKLVDKWMNKYNTDLQLFKDFKEKRENDESFEIPEMFIEINNFFEEMEDIENCFSDYFIKFNTDSELDINELEELMGEIESDSDDTDSINES
jgi:hypothetical protein